MKNQQNYPSRETGGCGCTIALVLIAVFFALMLSSCVVFIIKQPIQEIIKTDTIYLFEFEDNYPFFYDPPYDVVPFEFDTTFKFEFDSIFIFDTTFKFNYFDTIFMMDSIYDFKTIYVH